MKILANKYLRSVLFYAWLITILVLTTVSLPGKEVGNEGSGMRLDYLEHFIVYLLIPVFFYLSDGAWLEKIIKDSYYIFLIGLLFSILTEMQQYWIEGRTFNPVDMVFNLSGFLVGIPIGRKIGKVLPVH